MYHNVVGYIASFKCSHMLSLTGVKIPTKVDSLLNLYAKCKSDASNMMKAIDKIKYMMFFGNDVINFNSSIDTCLYYVYLKYFKIITDKSMNNDFV